MKKYLIKLKRKLTKINSTKFINNFDIDFFKRFEKIKIFKKGYKGYFLKIKSINKLNNFNVNKKLILENKLFREILKDLSGLNIKKLSKINPENAILYFFFTTGFISSLIIFFLIARPLNNKNTEIYEEIKIARDKRNNINALSLNLIKLKKEKGEINKDTLFLVNLIGGTKDLDTFTASINKIAYDNNISINNFEPKGIKKSNQNDLSKNNISNNPNTITSNNEPTENQNIIEKDIMLVPELEKHIIEISLVADFVKILNFIRDIELLENIVLIDDFKIVRLQDILKKPKSEIEYSTTFSAFGRVKNFISNQKDSKE